MKNIFITILFCLCHFICLGQDDSTQISFVAYWSIGDSYDFKVTKIKQQWKEGATVKDDTSSYIVNFEIMDSTESSYKIKWSYETNLKEFGLPENIRDKMSKYKLTEIIYTTTELGEYVGIENWEEVSKMLKGLFTDIIEHSEKDNKGKKGDLMESMKPIMSLFETKQGIEQLALRELQIFHFPFGIVLPKNEPLIYEESLPNMFGGNPIKADAKLYFDTVDVENSYCTLLQEMKLKPEDTKALISNIFKQMKIKDSEFNDAMKSARFDIRDFNKYEYYYNPGIPIKIETRRESLIDIGKEKGKRIDKTIIELLD